jgi:Mg-chelatase subunit ChlD
MKICVVAVWGIFLGLLGITGLPAQTQEDRDAAKRDVVVILDISGSMNENGKFANVKEYLNTEVFDGLLKNGDDFTLITFGNSAKVGISQTVSSGADRDGLRGFLQNLKADNHFTDIGRAMEELSAILENRKDPLLRQVILFITDGKNTPPRESPYYKKDLSVDEKFLSIGQKISKGGWFLYVIGIGGQTDAKAIADAVPGSVYTRTDEKLSDAGLQSFADKVDAETRAREEERRRLAEEEAARLRGQADDRTPEAGESAFSAFLKKLEGLTGISADIRVYLVLGTALLVLLAVALILLRALRPVGVIVSDNVGGVPNRVERRLGPMKGILLNSADGSLPGIGGEDKGVFRVERGVFGLKVRIMDEEAIAPKSPYKKAGVHKLKGAIIELVNGNKILVAVNRK